MLLRWLLLCIMLTASLAHAVGNEMINTLPDSNLSSFRTNSRTFWQEEIPDILGRYHPQGWVKSGGTHASSVSCVSSAFSTEAFTNIGSRTTANGGGGTGAINYTTAGCDCAGSDAAWVVISAQVGNSTGNFTRVSGTNYFVNCTDTLRPSLPSDSTWLMFTPMAGGALGTPTDLRRLTPDGPPGQEAFGEASLFEEMSAWWGASAGPFRVLGCTHAVSGTTSATIASCNAFTKDTTLPTQITHVRDTVPKVITYGDGEGIYWLAISPDISGTYAGWTRVEGSHYLTQKLSTHPAPINTILVVQKSTVAGEAIIDIDDTLAPRGAFDGDRSVYASHYGFICDGVTDNAPALVAATAALPMSGGRIILPASTLACKFNTVYTPDKTVWLQGQGGGKVNAGFFRRTIIECAVVGGNCMEILNKPTVGSRLEGFDMSHTGSADVGINLAFTSNVRIDDVTMNIPAVPFTDAAIVIGDTDTAHSVTLAYVYIRETGPTGIRIQRTNHVTIMHSTSRHHTVCNIDIGGGVAGRAKDTRIMYTGLESTKPGATAVCLYDAELVIINGGHFELSGNSFAAIATFSTSTQMEHLVVRDSWFTVIGVAPSAYTVISFDRPNTYAILEANRLAIADGSVLTSNSFVSVPNASGAAYITIEKNQLINNTAPYDPVQEIDHPENVTVLVKLSGNYGLLAAQIPLTKDSLQPWCINGQLVGSVTTGESVLQTCTIPGNTLYKLDVHGFRLTTNGLTAANGNNKRIRIRRASLTGDVLWDTGTIALNSGNWYATCLFVRSATLNAAMRGGCHGGAALSGVAGTSYTEAIGSTNTGTAWSEDQLIVITGEAATANSDVQVGATLMEIIR